MQASEELRTLLFRNDSYLHTLQIQSDMLSSDPVFLNDSAPRCGVPPRNEGGECIVTICEVNDKCLQSLTKVLERVIPLYCKQIETPTIAKGLSARNAKSVVVKIAGLAILKTGIQFRASLSV
jgi:hypothetical protein